MHQFCPSHIITHALNGLSFPQCYPKQPARVTWHAILVKVVHCLWWLAFGIPIHLPFHCNQNINTCQAQCCIIQYMLVSVYSWTAKSSNTTEFYHFLDNQTVCYQHKVSWQRTLWRNLYAELIAIRGPFELWDSMVRLIQQFSTLYMARSIPSTTIHDPQPTTHNK